jgi:hypothetical protein
VLLAVGLVAAGVLIWRLLHPAAPDDHGDEPTAATDRGRDHDAAQVHRDDR